MFMPHPDTTNLPDFVLYCYFLEKTRTYIPRTAKHCQYREPTQTNNIALTKRKKQLHISYHNGDHYNSVRRLSDLTSSSISLAANKPADVFIDVSNQLRIVKTGVLLKWSFRLK